MPVQTVDLPGVRIVLLDTSVEGVENGGVDADQLAQLDALAAEADRPVLLMGHHHAWNPDSAERPEHYFGINPDDSERLVEVVARRPRIVAQLAGHTHRNRVRRFAATGDVPWVEVSCVKDYPGAWAEYRVHEGGIVQVFHRISTPEALAWTEQTRHMYAGLYADYAFGTVADRNFLIPIERAAQRDAPPVTPTGVDGEIEDCIRTEYRRLVGAVAVVTGSTAAAARRLVAAMVLAQPR